MGEKNLKSMTLFILVGLFLVGVIVYVFVILPKESRRTLGSSDLVLDIPIQKWNLRYANGGVQGFCESKREWLSIEVSDGSGILSSIEGVVMDVNNKIVTIDIGDGLFMQYSPVKDSSLLTGDIVARGEKIGSVEGIFLNFRIKDERSRSYLCPYNYLNDFGKSILIEVEDVLGMEVVMCDCDSLDY